MKPSPPPIDELLRQRAFLGALARRLVRDDARADDLVQDTLVLALERGPKSGRSLRGWLARVAKNLAWRSERSDVRRQARERQAARPERYDEWVRTTLEAERELLAAVTELDEPFRVVLVLRYQQGLATAAIADELGIPLATVKSRLRRGRAKLRERMDREANGREMLALLAGLPAPDAASAVTVATLGGLTMTTKVLVSLGAAALVLLCLWGVLSERVVPVESSGLAYEVPEAPPSIGDPASSDSVEHGERSLLAAEPALEEVPAESDAVIRGFGLVVDLQGRPQSGLRVERSDSWDRVVDRVTSDDDGRFVLTGPAGAWSYAVEEENWTSILNGVEGTSGAGAEPLIVVAPVVRCGGRVLGPELEPLADVDVSFALPETWSAELDHSLIGGAAESRRTRTDERGRFELRVPKVAGGRLRAFLRSTRQQASLAVPPRTQLDLEIVLPALRELVAPLRGRVVDAGTGGGIAQAIVRVDWAGVRTDELGGFQLELEGTEPGAGLVAVAPGYQRTELDGSAGWVDDLVVVLEPALEIEGVVLDSGGRPRPDTDVYLERATDFGWTPEGVYQSLEGVSHDPEREQARTDDNGRFRLTGLARRSYSLVAGDPETLRVARLDVQAGASNVELAFTDEPLTPIRGQVTDGDGVPLAGVAISALRSLNWSFTNPKQPGSMMASDEVRTDANGYFRLPDAPLGVDRLELMGASVMPLEWTLDDQDRRELEIRAQRRADLRVSLGARWERCDRFRLERPGGDAEPVFSFEADFWGSQPLGWIEDGKSKIYTVAEGDWDIVLLAEGEDVMRTTKALRSGEVNVIRLD